MPAKKEYGSRKIHASTDDDLPAVSLMVGTAGHVDHGKTQLVKLLTGCETDRFPEEKARGMTIDLGFATCALPSRQRVGIIDVPGHERFVHNMVAGAAGIDVLLLVIAADDGVMPQTIEHFHIVRMLGVKDGFIAVTKTDLVAPERVEEVKQQAARLVAGSFLDGCPIVAVSSRTGDGLGPFQDTFTAVVNRTAERDCNGPFRLHVERAFVLHGRGVVVTGVPRTGVVRVGDTLELLPARTPQRVRSIQVYGRDSGQGRAGECVALNMAGLDIDSVDRGAVLAAPGYFETTSLVNARFQLLPHLDQALKPRTAVRFHVGTTDVPGHLVLPGLNPLPPGGESYVQVQLQEPVVAMPGDAFVVRSLSPMYTIGGGTVVSPDRKRLRRRASDEWTASLSESETAFRDARSAVEHVMRHADAKPLRTQDIARLALLTPEEVAAQVSDLEQAGTLVAVAGGHVHAALLEPVRTELLERLNARHTERPLSLGFAKKELFNALSSDRGLCEAALRGLLETGRVTEDEMGFRIPERKPNLTPRQAELAAAISDLYLETGMQTPRPSELADLLKADESEIKPVFAQLIQKGELSKLESNVVLHRDCLEQARATVRIYIKQHGSIDPAACRELLGTTRKYVIPLLEYLDARRVTRRDGNVRVLIDDA